MRQEQLDGNDCTIKLHKNCQRYVCTEQKTYRTYNQNKKCATMKADLPEEKSKQKMLRSSLDTFNWETICIFCGETCQNSTRHPDRNNCHKVTALHFKGQVSHTC